MTAATNGEPIIPKTHKACVYDQPGSCSISVQDVPTPEPGQGEVLVKLTHSGVCHSDYGIMMKQWTHIPQPTLPGQIGGHEGVGHIVKLGEGSEKSGVKVGDRVGIKWISSACLSCPPCTETIEGLCLNQKISGFYTPGTFQQYVIGPANYVTPVPESIPGEIAAPMLCAGLTTYAALRKCGAAPGQWIAISGAGGGLGTVATSLATQAMGFRVVGIDMPTKKQSVLDSGADHFVDATAFDDAGLAEEVKRLTGLGAVAVIVCAANNRAYAQAMPMLRFGGTLVVVGIPEGEYVPIAHAIPATMVAQQLNIISVTVGNRREAVETLEIAARGGIKFPVKTVGMGELQSVFETMGQGKINGRVVLDLSRV
ncbi:alcohol dehydrogenase-like protein [Nemania sp. FL0031]|nr:alcohol dehydrogenase-like protein [Nemania sp. FL0031]